MASPPSQDALEYRTAREISAMVGTGELSPLEVVDYFAARIEQREPEVNAFVTLDLAAARETAQARGKHLADGGAPAPLEGIPVGVKDLIPTKGLRTTNGMKFFQDNVPDFDGVEVERLRAAGAIVIGKTNTPAFGHKDTSDNLVVGPSRNPWNLDRTTGGSSGGAAAAVAAGYGPISHGTDGAGSVRIPAAWSGVYGLKPSMGRIPVWPSGDLWSGRVHVGPLSRDVRDAALMLDVMAGPDPRDPLSLAAKPGSFLAACDQPVKGLKLAFSADLGFAPIDPEITRIVTKAAVAYEELGCEVVPISTTWPDPTEWHTILFRAGVATKLKPLVEARPEWIDDSLREVYELGQRITAEQYINAQAARTVFYDWARKFMSDYDGLLTATMPVGAWPIDNSTYELGGKVVSPVAGGRWPLVYIFNVLGWPASTVPCGFTSDGLPVGLQIVTPWQNDERCLALSASYEEHSPWAGQAFPLG